MIHHMTLPSFASRLAIARHLRGANGCGCDVTAHQVFQVIECEQN